MGKKEKEARYSLKSIEKEKVFIGNIDYAIDKNISVMGSIIKQPNIDEIHVKIGIRLDRVTDAPTRDIIFEVIMNYVFDVIGINEIEKDGVIKLPEIFLNNLLSVACSTTRGILFEITSGKFVLPLIDPSNLVKNLKVTE